LVELTAAPEIFTRTLLRILLIGLWEDLLFGLTVTSNRCCFELHLPLHFVLDTKQIKNTMMDPEHDNCDFLLGRDDNNAPKTPPITNSWGVNTSSTARYVPQMKEQWKQWRSSIGDDSKFLSLVNTYASARDITLTEMFRLVMGYLNEETFVSPSEDNDTYDGTFVSPIDDTNNQTPATSNLADTPNDKDDLTQAPITPSEMFSRGGMAVGHFIERLWSDLKDAMETNEGKATREKIKSSIKEARSVASSILKSAKSAFKDFALVDQKGNQNTTDTIAWFPTEIEAIMGVCFDSQSADNMSPQELSEVINCSIEKSRQGTNLGGGNSTATPGMINSILKPLSDYTETTLPRQTTPMPSKTVTKADLQGMDNHKKPAAKIPPHDWITPLIIETISEMTEIDFGRLLDDAYIIGGGIDVNSHSLWNYQTIHALCVKKYLASLAYKKFGSEGFKGNSIDAQRRVYLGAIWLLAEAPLCLQGTAQKTREKLNAGEPVKAVGFDEPVFVETFKQYLSVGLLQLFYQQMRAWAKVSPHHDLLGAGFVINYYTS
jgi:hypothetical protein